MIGEREYLPGFRDAPARRFELRERVRRAFVDQRAVDVQEVLAFLESDDVRVPDFVEECGHYNQVYLTADERR
jgi:hypothetical protein